MPVAMDLMKRFHMSNRRCRFSGKQVCRVVATRRQILEQTSLGFGALAARVLFAEESDAPSRFDNPLAPKAPHLTPRAKSVIFMYMDGGISQVDSFDPKPRLAAENGQARPFAIDATVFNQNGNLLASPWRFKRCGQSGIPISDLFPQLRSVADELCVIRSMTAFSANHPNATYALHSGHARLGRPSVGAWVTYGLGTQSRNFPGFVVVHGGQMFSGGMSNIGSGFLPANYQGSMMLPSAPYLPNLLRQDISAGVQTAKQRVLRQLDQDLANSAGENSVIEAAIANHELAFRMQSAAPELFDLSRETAPTKKRYGLEAEYANTRKYGTQCLIARRLVERGVRFIELTINPGNSDRWDQHSDLKNGHARNALAVDQPVAALIKDLKARGLLDSTLIVCTSEFGRTPFAQGTNGRDHNPQGFSMWMAGGGIRGGTVYGATDEYGYRAVENKLTVHDLHANMLYLLGIDHTRLTFRFGGRDVRLTDVHGRIVNELIA